MWFGPIWLTVKSGRRGLLVLHSWKTISFRAVLYISFKITPGRESLLVGMKYPGGALWKWQSPQPSDEFNYAIYGKKRMCFQYFQFWCYSLHFHSFVHKCDRNDKIKPLGALWNHFSTINTGVPRSHTSWKSAYTLSYKKRRFMMLLQKTECLNEKIRIYSIYMMDRHFVFTSFHMVIPSK